VAKVPETAKIGLSIFWRENRPQSVHYFEADGLYKDVDPQRDGLDHEDYG